MVIPDILIILLTMPPPFFNHFSYCTYKRGKGGIVTNIDKIIIG